MGQFDFLLGAQPVKTPGPLDYAQQGLSLSSLMDSATMRRIAMQQAQTEQMARDALNQSLPAVMASNWDPKVLQEQVAANPAAGGPLLDLYDKKRKSDADYANTQAQAAERTSIANKNKTTPLSNIAYGLSQDPALTPEKIGAFQKLVAANGAENLLPSVPFQSWTDPDKARPLLAMAGKAFFDAEKQAGQAETGRHDLATEGLTASAQAETGRHNVSEEGIQRTNAGIAAGHLTLARQQFDPFGVYGVNPKPVLGAVNQPAQPGQAAPVSPAQAMQQGLTGEDFLKTLPDALANQVRAYGEGRRQIPPRDTPGTAQMMTLVGQAYPDFDQTTYGMRNKTRMDFAAGTDGRSVRSISAGLSHLDLLDKMTDALNNNDIPLLNKLSIAYAQQTGQPGPTNFDAVKNAMSAEVVKAITGGGGGVTDREHAADTFAKSGSPAQLKGASNAYRQLFVGQIDAYKRQYEAGTQLNDFNKFISPEAQGLLSGGGGAPVQIDPGTELLLKKYGR